MVLAWNPFARRRREAKRGSAADISAVTPDSRESRLNTYKKMASTRFDPMPRGEADASEEKPDKAPPLLRLMEGLNAKWVTKAKFLDEVFGNDGAPTATREDLAEVCRDFDLPIDVDDVVKALYDGHADASDGLARATIEKLLEDAEFELEKRSQKVLSSTKTTISASIEQFTVRGGAPDGDGLDASCDQLVHPHAYNGYLAVVTHNNTKPAMKAFIEENIDIVSLFPIVTTRSTGTVLEKAFGLLVQHKTMSGPLGGDQEIGGMISHGEIDAVLFFRDPLAAHPHDDDIKALMRICDVHCVPTATNPSTGRAVLHYLASLAASRAEAIASGQADTAAIVTKRKSNPDSAVVEAYKAGQAKVITSIAAAK